MKKLFAFVLTLLLTAPAFGLQDTSEWTKFTSDAGRFSVLMPGKPEENKETKPSPNGPYTVNLYIAKSTAGIYMAGWVDYDPKFNFGVQAELEANRDNFIKGVSGKLLDTKPIKFGANPGIEFTAETDLVFVRSRVYIIGKRPYQLLAIVRKDDRSSPSIDKFLSSFALTPK